VNLESVTSKHISELEQLTSQLLISLRKAKLHDDPMYILLQQLEQELGETRRHRFDNENSEYSGY
jgi:hypothetical protein